MIKFPFTPDGVAAMCRHYFELPDETLATAANEMGQDFKRWVTNNFTLEESQLDYLNGIAPSVVAFMGANASFALVNRCPIVLTKQSAKAEEPSESKLTKPKSKLNAVILPNGGFTAEGELEIEITY